MRHFLLVLCCCGCLAAAWTLFSRASAPKNAGTTVHQITSIQVETRTSEGAQVVLLDAKTMTSTLKVTGGGRGDGASAARLMADGQFRSHTTELEKYWLINDN